jgi:hypothetical protein
LPFPSQRLILNSLPHNISALTLTLSSSPTAPDATQFGEHTVTQKHLYLGLFVIGLPLLWLASPISTIFWIIGASAVLVLGHACLMEPGVESEYAAIDGETV